MPVKCVLQNGKWVVRDSSGDFEAHGEHDSRESCNKQAAKINASLKASQEFFKTLKPEDTVYSCPSGLELTATDDPLVFKKQVIYEGRHKKGDMEFEVGTKVIDHWIDTFIKWQDLGVKVPLPKEHTNDPEENRGEVVGLSREKDAQGRESLYSTIKFRDDEAAKMAKTADVSLYSPAEWEAAGQSWERPIVHVALTDYPVIPGLGDFAVVASLLKKEVPSVDPLQELLGDLNLSLGDGEDAKTLLLSTIQKLQTEAAKVPQLESDLRLARSQKKQEPVAVPRSTIQLHIENREMKLSRLVEDCRISPHVKDGLMKLFCQEPDLKFSLGTDTDDKFNALIELLKDNEVVPMGDTVPTAITLSKEQIGDPKHNPVMADAQKRADAAKASAN